MTPSERVAVGRVVKPHGIRGEVSVKLLSDFPDRFAAGARLVGEGREYVVLESRPHHGRLLVRFAGVSDRTGAERLRGLELEADARDHAGDEFYLASELVGMEVRHEDGRSLGSVAALVELPTAAGYDLLEVRGEDGRTWLLPVVGEYVEVDVAEDGREVLVLVSPPEGLVEGGGE